MTSQELMAIAGVIISIVFEYFPKLSEWYNLKPDNQQRMIMLGVVFVVAFAAYGLSCAGLVDAWTCDTGGFWAMLKILIAGVVANQATYTILPRKAEAESPVV